MTLTMVRVVPKALLAAVISAWTAAACGRGDPPPQAPSTARSASPTRVSGTEKVEWDQAAFDSTQLARYRYVVYVDDVPIDLVGATCGPTTNNATFPCSARLPKLAAGLHRLQLAAEETDGQRRRSPRSGELVVDVAPSNATP